MKILVTGSHGYMRSKLIPREIDMPWLLIGMGLAWAEVDLTHGNDWLLLFFDAVVLMLGYALMPRLGDT